MEPSRLHITNGDIAAQRIRDSGLGGRTVAWRDVLHEGPVPSGLSLDEMSRVRARFLAGFVWSDPYEQLLRGFEERDAALKAYKRSDEVVLWFEHDLCDQLQLLQLLQWFFLRRPPSAELSLVSIGEHPAVPDFRGLGQLEPRQLAGLWEERTRISEEQLELGSRGWDAFCSDRPLRLQALLREDLAALPFLRAALKRHLEQFPSTRDGLSRTERQILEVLSAGPAELERLYRESQIDREEAPFLADRPFLLYVEQLGAERALLEFEDGRGVTAPPHDDEFWRRRVGITEPGRKVLAGQADRIRFQKIDRWLGGVHLRGDAPAWRWGHKKREIVAQRV